MIKSFRGLLADEEIERIKLSTNDGLTGYTIKKFEIISETPGIGDADHVVQLFSVPQTAASATVNFDNPTLMGVAFVRMDANNVDITARYGKHIVFDNVTVNQDVYVTLKNARNNTRKCNFYLEMEQVKLDINEATVATLKDMRGRE